MPFIPLRPVPLPPPVQDRNRAWLDELSRALDDPGTDRNDLCAEVLTSIYYPQFVGVDRDTLRPVTRVALDQMDPRNVTLEPEYYGELDPHRYAAVKPLLWLWEMFDRSPLGENVDLGIRFRRLLAQRIFRRCGRNFKAFPFVRFSFGYNMEVGDDVVIHRHVLLDDRGGIEIGNGASVSDFANVYSHSHDIVDGRIIQTPVTRLEDGVRITYHATVLSGVTVARDSMVGTSAVVTRDTLPHTVHVGVPARPVKQKPAEERARKAPRTGDPLAED